MRKLGERRGAVLIVVLGVLAILALLAVTFNSVMGVERSVARSYLDEVRARLIARAGVEHALNRIDGMDVGLDNTWAYTSSLTLEETDKPSFFARVPATSPAVPKSILIDGKPRGYTDQMSSCAYTTGGDVYSVRMVDCNALLNVNDGSKFGSTHSVSRNLRRMLGVLGTLVGVNSTVTDKIVDNRPTGGYRSKYEVLGRIGNDYASFDKIKNFITASAWEDPTVVEPVPLSAASLGPNGYPSAIQYFRGSPAIYRYARDKRADGSLVGAGGETLDLVAINGSGVAYTDERAKVFSLDELNPQWIEVTQRAPINVNAASKEVLVVALSGLKGFFISERLGYNPSSATWSVNDKGLGHFGKCPLDRWTGQKLGYTTERTSGTYPSSMESMLVSSSWGWSYSIAVPSALHGVARDEIGQLYETEEIKGPTGPLSGTSVMAANTAVTLADEIIACRDKVKGPAAFDYATAAFGGSFRTWSQWNLFCDNLVKIGVLKETRSIWYDRMWAYGFTTNTPTYVAETVAPNDLQKREAAKALADVLKANFNPNVHLNELNPDANLASKVDKTDLIVHSTEFCLYPPGRFELESLGRVLKLDKGTTTTAAAYITVAEAKISAVTKLWDCYRETSQKQFYAGDEKASDFTAGPTTATTNSNGHMETGPEQDEGKAPKETEYDGYIGLATNGGEGAKAKDALVVSVRQAPEFGSTGEWLHAHYARDPDANYHKYATGAPYWHEVNRWRFADKNKHGTFVDQAENHANNGAPSISMGAESGAARPPYDPNWPTADYCRLCWNFKSPTTTSLPSITRKIASDMRVDGIYSHRNHAPGYIAMNGLEMENEKTDTTLYIGSDLAT